MTNHRPSSAITPGRTYVERVETPDGPLLIERRYDLEHSFWLEVGDARLGDAITRLRAEIPGDREPGFFARLQASDETCQPERPVVPAAA